MYYPYLRGKQFELSALRELTEVFSEGLVVPIIEPVRSRINSLARALNALNESGARNILILNPQVGDFAQDHAALLRALESNDLLDLTCTTKAIIVASESDVEIAAAIFSRYDSDEFVLVIERSRLSGLAEFINSNTMQISMLVCDELKVRPLIRSCDIGRDKIIVRADGFQKEERNADYDEYSDFSEVHLIWYEDAYAGFSDYLTVGNIYSESGGPAYTVALHLTSLTDTDELEVHHFKSDSNQTYLDTAGKFSEALVKLHRASAQHFPSSALEEYTELFQSGHFPGLGYVKKLSIKHHIELVNDWLRQRG